MICQLVSDAQLTHSKESFSLLGFKKKEKKIKRFLSQGRVNRGGGGHTGEGGTLCRPS